MWTPSIAGIHGALTTHLPLVFGIWRARERFKQDLRDVAIRLEADLLRRIYTRKAEREL